MFNFIIKVIVGTITATVTYMGITMAGIFLFYDKIFAWTYKTVSKVMDADYDDDDDDNGYTVRGLFA